MPWAYTLDLAVADPSHKTQIDLFREWFHFVDSDKQYYPDALIPVRTPYSSRLPEPDNRISNQTAQAFWVDVYIPAHARPGTFRGSVRLKSAAKVISLPMRLTVLAPVIPPEDVLTMDHNSYGSSWLAEQFPASYRRDPSRIGSRAMNSSLWSTLITVPSTSTAESFISSVMDTREGQP